MGLSGILWTFGGFLFIFLLLFILPWRVYIQGTLAITSELTSGSGSILLGGKKAGICLRFYPQKRITLGHYQHPVLTITLHKKRQKRRMRSSQRIKTFNSKHLKMGQALLKGLEIVELDLRGQVGLPNPMHTGLIYGYGHLIPRMMPEVALKVIMEPVFSGQWNTHLDGTVALKFSPVYVTWQAVKTYFKFRD